MFIQSIICESHLKNIKKKTEKPEHRKAMTFDVSFTSGRVQCDISADGKGPGWGDTPSRIQGRHDGFSSSTGAKGLGFGSWSCMDLVVEQHRADFGERGLSAVLLKGTETKDAQDLKWWIYIAGVSPYWWRFVCSICNGHASSSQDFVKFLYSPK